MGWFSRMFHRIEEDWVDRANGCWTVFLLSICAAGAFLVRFITDPITCWTPAHFTSPMNSYTYRKCFLQEHYYVLQPRSNDINGSNEASSYHLWIPLILFFQAICFLAPNLIWRCFKYPVSINLESTLSSLEHAQFVSPESKTTFYKNVALLVSKKLNKNNFLLALLYLGTKILYCINLLGQFIFLTIYFKQELAIKAGEKAGFDISGYLKPLLLQDGICSYEINAMNKVLAFSFQCLLPITEIYEKLFVFLWYWVFFLTAITILNLIVWAALLFIPFFRNRKLLIYIAAFGTISTGKEDNRSADRFISAFLGISGVFLLYSMGNSNEVVAADLTGHLFEEFKHSQPTIDEQMMSSAVAEQEIEKGENGETPLESFTISEKTS